jgi:hypothetical protein
MKKLVALGLMLLLAGMFGNAYAAGNTDQTVTYQVTSIDEISVSGNPGALIVNTADPGSQPTAVTDASTSFSITTNNSSRKITGSLDSAMPANTSLKVTLTAPTGGASAGQVTLNATAQDLVTGISTLAESGKTISYEFSATLDAGIISSSQRTVTFTIADGS